MSSYSTCPPMNSHRRFQPASELPGGFVLHGHLPPSHMASIKPTVIISVKNWVRLTGVGGGGGGEVVVVVVVGWGLAVLNSTDLKHKQVIDKSATCLQQQASLRSHLGSRNPLMSVPFCFQSNPTTLLITPNAPSCLSGCNASALDSQWKTDNSLVDRALLKAL